MIIKTCRECGRFFDPEHPGERCPTCPATRTDTSIATPESTPLAREQARAEGWRVVRLADLRWVAFKRTSGRGASLAVRGVSEGHVLAKIAAHDYAVTA